MTFLITHKRGVSVLLSLFLVTYLSLPVASQNPPLNEFPDEGEPESKYKPDTDKVFRLLSPELDNALVESALKDLLPPPGVREHPSNWGPRVQVYLASCGIKKPAAWCAAFVNYHIRQGEKKIKKILPGPVMWRPYANVNDVYSWASNHNLVLSRSANPHKGCIFLVRRKKKKRGHTGDYQHIGIVVTVNTKNKTITTIEGNSNNDGSDEGIGVFTLTRSYAKGRLVFIEAA